MKDVKYFHELTGEELDDIVKSNKNSWEELSVNFSQPLWCKMPNCISAGGCRSLLMGVIYFITSDNCKECQFFKK